MLPPGTWCWTSFTWSCSNIPCLSHCQGCAGAGRVWLCCILGNNLLSSLSAIPDGCPDKTMLPIKAKVSAAFSLAAPVDPHRADSCDEQALSGEPWGCRLYGNHPYSSSAQDIFLRLGLCWPAYIKDLCRSNLRSKDDNTSEDAIMAALALDRQCRQAVVRIWIFSMLTSWL